MYGVALQQAQGQSQAESANDRVRLNPRMQALLLRPLKICTVRGGGGGAGKREAYRAYAVYGREAQRLAI